MENETTKAGSELSDGLGVDEEVFLCPCCGEEVRIYELKKKPKAPDQCHCDPKDWGDPYNIPPICNVFIPMSEEEPELCKKCEHLKECHL